MKVFRRILFIFLACTLLVPNLLEAEEKVVLQLRWDHQFQFAGYYAAKWQGYYKAADLKVEIRSAVSEKGIASAIEEVRSGRADFGIGAADILIANDHGANLKLLASIFQHSASGFYARAETPIHTLHDLLDLKVARKVNDLIDVELQAILLAEGIAPERLQTYPHQPGMDHLISGRVDLVPGYIISFPFEAGENGVDFKTIRPTTYGIDFYGDSLFTTSEKCDLSPEIVDRFIQASLRGWDYALKHPKVVIDQIVDRLDRTAIQPQIKEFNAFQSSRIVPLMNYPEVQIGHINPGRWQQMHSQLKRVGAVGGDIDMEAFVFDFKKFQRRRAEFRQSVIVALISAAAVVLTGFFVWVRTLRAKVRSKTLELSESNKRLAESEAQYRELVELAQEGIWVIDKESNTRFVNASMAKMLGYTPEEMVGQHLFQFMGEQGRAIAEENLERRRNGIREQHDFEFVHKDGHLIYATMETAPIFDENGRYNGAIAGMIDITERRRMELALKESEKRYRDLYHNTPAMMHSIDAQGNLLSISDYWLNQLGYSREEVIGKKSVDFLSEKSRMEAIDNYLPQFYRDGFISDVPYQFIKKDGQTIDVMLSAVSEKDRSGNLMRTLAVLMDVTQRKKAEKALLESEARWRSLVENAPDLILTVDEKGKILYINGPLEGEQVEKTIGKNVVDCIASEYRRDIKRLIREVFQTGVTQTIDLEAKRARDDYRWYTTRIGAIHEGNRVVAALLFTRDITFQKQAELRQRKLENQLAHARKMESIGTLAGGIAHDFNNILYMIMGNAELALDDIPQWNPVHENIQEIKDASLRAAGIVKQLLNFSRKSNQKLAAIGAVAVVRDALKFIRSTLPSTIELKSELPKSEITILGDPIQIHQALMNILANSSQAMEESGGTIVIGVDAIRSSDENLSEFPDLAEGDYLRLTISDSGPGIADEAIEHIFEPYFTTKEIGRGSGMGLAVVHGIVTHHNGRISVYSKAGQGAHFTLLFPVVAELPAMVLGKSAQLPQGTESVLLVDDERSIAKFVSKMLSGLGYAVTSCTHAIEALGIFKTRKDEFDLVITDMTMPKMTGDILSRRIKEICPDTPIIICTGHNELIDEAKARALGIEAFLIKPITKSDLAQTVRKVLAGPEG